MNEEKLSPIHPGEILLEEFLMPMEITREKLANHISIPLQSVSDIISGRSPITASIALRLGIFFGMSPRFWLDLQTDYDLDMAEDELEEQLNKGGSALCSLNMMRPWPGSTNSLTPNPALPNLTNWKCFSALCEAYEEENYPINAPDPVEALKCIMEWKKLERSDLEHYIGTKEMISEILNRERSLTPDMIIRLEKGLGVPADMLTPDADKASSDRQIAAMAEDPEILAELRKTEEEFMITESDGLEETGEDTKMIKTEKFIPDNEKWLHHPDVSESLDSAIAWAEEHPPRETDLKELENRISIKEEKQNDLRRNFNPKK